MINFSKMMGKVVNTERRDGDRISGRLVEIIDKKYLKLRFRYGAEAYIAIESIDYIAPARYQPEPDEVI